MNAAVKYPLLIVAYSLLLMAAGYLVISTTTVDIQFSDLSALTLLFALITIVSTIIFLRGQNRGPESQTMHTLVAVSLKFLLELALTLLWLIVLKKTEKTLVVLFFILYLAFSLFLVLFILKTLKNKSL